MWVYWEGKIVLVLTLANALFIFQDYIEKYVPQLFNNWVGNLVQKAKNPKFALVPTILVAVFAISLIIRLDVAKVDISTIPYLKDIMSAELYNVDFINYSKRLISVGIIFLIISFVLKTIFDKVSSKLNSGIRNYINETQRIEAEISRKNDMEIKIKQEKAKNTSYVECPNCRSDNLLGEKYGTCKYCRRKLENKNYN